MNDDPHARALVAFAELLEQARVTGDPEPTAMTVATLGQGGRLAARTVLLKAFDERGFVFYTNFESRKGRELIAHPQAALLFHWKTVRDGVQVRVEGKVEPVSDAEADVYFASRPRGSQLGAWASLQSTPMPSREEFERRYAQFEQQYDGRPVPRPPHWSGFRLVPDAFEFWYGAQFRLHERYVYRLQDGTWTEGMLYP